MFRTLSSFIAQLWRKRFVRYFGFFILGLIAVGVCFVLISELYISKAKDGRVVSHVSELPDQSIGLVLGCSSHLPDGRQNHYFINRIDAASNAWKSGKLRAIIVSGDNRWHDYNEPDDMKAALIEKGVPSDKIVCDYAGLRTLDSVVRAKEIFDAGEVVIISQEFHNERALAIAYHFDLDAFAYNAKDVYSRKYRIKSWIRERAARVAMLGDLWVLNTEPKHLGDKEAIPQ